MRIVSGKYKGRRFSIPKNFKARPTTDLAKEGLFNVLNNRIDWEETKALDLFGGTGGIGIEIISRGCPEVTCIEKEPLHYAFIEKVKSELQIDNLNVYKMDVFKFLEFNVAKFDLIFADPPYDLKDFENVPKLVLGKDMLNDGGVFILEHPANFDFSHYPFFTEKRNYGSVNFSFFQKD